MMGANSTISNTTKKIIVGSEMGRYDARKAMALA
jgi:hypothetical protein